MLINSSHEYTFPSDDTDLVTLYGNIDTESFHVSDMVIKLDSNALNALNELMKAFHAQTNNDDITIIGGYRTLEEQLPSSRPMFPDSLLLPHFQSLGRSIQGRAARTVSIGSGGSCLCP